ncbi:hypothetical protein BH23ACT9_BH23ACT9_17060 [soil metagenome]
MANGIINGLDDADSARERHREVGLDMLPVWPRQRQWRLPSGEELMIRFRVLVPEPGQSPLTFNGGEYLTLEHYLRPEFQRHPNGEIDLSSFTPPAYCCITIEVVDLDIAAAILSTNGVAHAREQRRILIGPAEACGNVLELTTAPFSERRSRS